MIPISLYVAIEILKLSQNLVIGRDVKMYDKETRAFAQCKNSDLTEELGQVQMIFSDKTGTLTMNKMEFKKCSIRGGLKFGELESGEKPIDGGMCESGRQAAKNKIKENDLNTVKFFKALAVCHTVVCEAEMTNNGIPKYQASSPDELALVLGAADVGLIFHSRSH